MQNQDLRGSPEEPEIRIQRVQQLPDQRAAVQTRTFTRWINVFLQGRDPPVEVLDLLVDVQDGRILLALLEELTGSKLLYRFRSSSHRIFRLSNISTALNFLDDRHVKLLGIDASGIADGTRSVVLNLVWNMILYFQVKEVAGDLQRSFSCCASSSSDLSATNTSSYSCSSLPRPGRKAATKHHGKAIRTLLQWVQRSTSKFGVEVQDFSWSWRSGLAFLALIKSINPDLVDLRVGLSREPRENLQLAFRIAHHSLDIPPLLETEDVSGPSPDEKSIITYVSMFLRCCCSDQDLSADPEFPQIPNFGSLESVHLGEILTDDPEAQALVHNLEKSSEQRLWTCWSRKSPQSPGGTSEIMSRFTKSQRQSVLQPPSPLEAGVTSQDIRSWMDTSAGQDRCKPGPGEGHFSLSSEEGIYTLPVLDSDEEDAYSYILDLNKEVFQPGSQLKRHVETVEEETDKEMKNQEVRTPSEGHQTDQRPCFNPEDHGPERAASGEDDRKMEVEVQTDGEEEDEKQFEEAGSERRLIDKCDVGGGGAARNDTKEELACEDDEEDYSHEVINLVEMKGPEPDSNGCELSQSFGVQPPETSQHINPSELQILLVLWILLYCCFILPQVLF